LAPIQDAGFSEQTRHFPVSAADISLANGKSGKMPIHPQYLSTVLNRMASDEAIFTCDVGTPTVWAARYFAMNGKRRLLGSFNHGAMANALPQAIGAQTAFPDRQVISLSGDGGLAMLMGELLTLRQLKAPVKMIVYQKQALPDLPHYDRGFRKQRRSWRKSGFTRSVPKLIIPAAFISSSTKRSPACCPRPSRFGVGEC